MKYRPDIDGLRAIAIISVVIFHTFPKILKSGFVGVDIFFVISGFLITNLVLKDLENFSITDFYIRRIKRIFPALIIVLLSCFIFGWLMLFSDEFKQLNKHIAASSTFISNFILLKESGYFDSAALTKPLLHLWSLAIEEQFYIFFPLFLIVTRARKVWLAIALFLSLSLCIYQYYSNQLSSSFFLPQARAWEFLIGAFVAHLKISNKNLSIVGLALVIASTLSIKESSFPGWQALFPTLGAALIIMSEKSWINEKILSNKALVWVGLISYPLYLWHWPLVSFAHILLPVELAISIKIGLILLSILLAWLTFEFIEKPTRFGKFSQKAVAASLVFIMVITGLTAFALYKNSSFHKTDRIEFEEYFENSLPEWRFVNTHNLLVTGRDDCNFSDSEKYRIGEPTVLPKEISKSCYTRDFTKKKIIFLWGDSHAQHLFYGINKNIPKDWQVMIIASSGCSAEKVLKDSEDHYCQRSNYTAFKTIQAIKPDVVLIAQNESHNYEKFKKLSAELSAKRVLFAGPIPHWQKDLPKIIMRNLWYNTPERTFVQLNKKVIENNLELEKQFAGSKDFINIMQVFCNEQGCLTRIGDDRKTGITSFDWGHLLPIASDYLAKNLLIEKITSR